MEISTQPLLSIQCKTLLLLVASLTLFSCGGGSGTGGGTGDGNQFKLHKTQVTATTDIFGYPQSVDVTGSISGDLSSTVYIVIDSSASPLIESSSVSLSGNTGTLSLYPAPPEMFGPGSHQGTVQVSACRDAQCNRHYSGSPQTLLFTYEILNESDFALSLSENTLDYSVVAHANQFPITTQIQMESPQYTAAWGYMTPPEEWLTFDIEWESSFHQEGSIDFEIPNEMPVGEYQSQIGVYVMGPYFMETVDVYLTVQENAFELSNPNPSFSLNEETSSDDLQHTLTITSNSENTLNWQALSNADWITLSNDDGSTDTDNAITISLNTNVNNLAQGSHTATVEIRDASGIEASYFVDISFDFDLPTINLVAPHTGFVQEPQKVIIRGEGFSEEKVNSLLVGDIDITNYAVISENEMIAEFPGMPEGDYTISIGNSSGLEIGDSEYSVTPRKEHTAAVYEYDLNGDTDLFLREEEVNKKGDTFYFSIYDSYGTRKNYIYKVSYANSTWTETLLFESFDSIQAYISPNEKFVALLNRSQLGLTLYNLESMEEISAYSLDTFTAVDRLEFVNNQNVILFSRYQTLKLNLTTSEFSSEALSVFEYELDYPNTAVSPDYSRIFVRNNRNEDTLHTIGLPNISVTDTGLDISLNTDIHMSASGEYMAFGNSLYNQSFVNLGTLPYGSVLAPFSTNAFAYQYNQERELSTIAIVDLNQQDEYGNLQIVRQLSDAPEYDSNGITAIFAISRDENTAFLSNKNKIIIHPIGTATAPRLNITSVGDLTLAGPNADMDGDGTINSEDSDIDGDNVSNEDDKYPYNANEWLDTDGDLQGNNADEDDDNDGVIDSLDAMPLNSTEAYDTDGDGIGDNLDTDDDNDGVEDIDDNAPKSSLSTVGPQWVNAVASHEAHVLSGTTNYWTDITLGDLDNDDDNDLVPSISYNGDFYWYENNGESIPEFTLTASFFTSASSAGKPRVVDLNGDGHNDVLLSVSSGEIIWYENDGEEDPSFVERSIVEDVWGSHTSYPLDIDADGDLDIVSLNSSSNIISWYENSGSISPSFTEHVVFDPEYLSLSSLYIGDFNNDGFVDLVASEQYSGFIYLFRNKGEETPLTFARSRLEASSSSTFSLAVADINNDGLSDIVTTSFTSDTFKVFTSLGDSSMTFTEASYSASLGMLNLIVNDVDNDGDNDIVATLPDENQIVWFENDGSLQPEFYTRLVRAEFENPRAVLVADINGDNQNDILTMSTSQDIEWHNYTAYKIQVLEGVRYVSTESATDEDEGSLIYAIFGGKDAEKFSINELTGEINFIAAPLASTPQDTDGDNSYEVSISVTDGFSTLIRKIVVQVIE